MNDFCMTKELTVDPVNDIEEEFEIRFTATRGYPGSYYQPPEGPEVEVYSIKLVGQHGECIDQFDDQMDMIEEMCFEHLDEVAEDDEAARSDYEYERMRERNERD